MCRKNKILIIIIIIAVIINMLSGCILYINDGFNNKEEIIELIKGNIDDLNQLTKEIYNKYSKVNRLQVIIENKIFKVWPISSFEHRTKLSNKIFKKLKIDTVVINNDKETRNYDVKYVVKNKFGTYCGFYYSFDDNKNYYTFDNNIMLQLKKEGMYIELGKKTSLLDSKHSWYTEKICGNWYFFEEDFDNLNFMIYIYDDLINMNPKSKYFEEHKAQFERYNSHKQEVYEE